MNPDDGTQKILQLLCINHATKRFSDQGRLELLETSRRRHAQHGTCYRIRALPAPSRRSPKS